MPSARAVETIPIFRPRLPSADALLPWLRRIDESHVYSNFGPLSAEFSHRFAGHFGLADGGNVLPVANATLGLVAALLAVGARRGALCAIPAFTFVATGHAVLSAGLRPWLLDVREDDWQLDPAAVERALASAPDEMGAVIPVCPFGQPVDWRAWQDFQDRTGIPVVIDAAAAFDSYRPTPLPAVISLHATKVLGVGEGGVIVCENADLVAEAKRRINFGFQGMRVAGVAATNAKLSEYHAAIGLAALDGWRKTRSSFAAAQAGLRARLEAGGLSCPAGMGDDWVSSSFCLGLPVDAQAVGMMLAAQGIGTRRWWDDGLHHHPAFADCLCEALPVTESLARRVLGLPCHVDLDAAALDAIAAATLAAVARLG
ncbi:DegT/DnrJ/EryC1/StrS aminotransferase family protein [Magnetospirillum sp. SS-4]|uniref:DegT/DnrJ/EryC1/StrS family aminotransferase n=1 Tax=Magnetospirillum sp. SS-4 TaxID=2681465 RepID=UPI00138096A4|nr:DegT/DnrJ/EryC1/StrS family aminotransferase [Magnetospirillum sp. SS-4]CAA7626302.1 DegT/DnrJ/EryC1/StrS aminotransferase [Magnetospirillum sp. SS-4]